MTTPHSLTLVTDTSEQISFEATAQTRERYSSHLILQQPLSNQCGQLLCLYQVASLEFAEHQVTIHVHLKGACLGQTVANHVEEKPRPNHHPAVLLHPLRHLLGQKCIEKANRNCDRRKEPVPKDLTDGLFYRASRVGDPADLQVWRERGNVTLHVVRQVDELIVVASSATERHKECVLFRFVRRSCIIWFGGSSL